MKKKVIEEARAVVKAKLEELMEEEETIIKVAAQYRHFLSANSMKAKHDVFSDYLAHILEEEKQKAKISKQYVVVDAMEKVITRYEALINNYKARQREYPLGRIKHLHNVLMGLEIYGQHFEEAFKLAVELQSEEHGYEEHVNPHDDRYLQSNDDSVTFTMDSAQETKSTNEQDDQNLAGKGYKMSKKNAEISERLTAIEKEFSAIRQLLTNDSDNEEEHDFISLAKGSDSAMEYDSEPNLQTKKQIKATGKPAPFERAD